LLGKWVYQLVPCHKNIQENPGSLETSPEILHMAKDKIAQTGYYWHGQ
jgi:hypothetical protein